MEFMLPAPAPSRYRSPPAAPTTPTPIARSPDTLPTTTTPLYTRNLVQWAGGGAAPRFLPGFMRSVKRTDAYRVFQQNSAQGLGSRVVVAGGDETFWVRFL